MQAGRSAWLGVALVWLVGCGSSADRVPQELTRRSPEPAGAHCAYGGTAIATGVDRDGDGALDDGEVRDTTYECNPASTTLVRSDVLGADLTCPRGGTAVSTGLDDNRDGVLQDAEIDATSVQCASLEHWTGDFTADDWTDPVKVAALRGARVVDGALTIAPSGTVMLPLLEVVHGDLVARGALSDLRLDALRTIDGSVTVEATQLHVLSLPVLDRIGGDLSVVRTGELGATITAPGLHEIAGRLSFAMDATGLIALPALTSVGALAAGGSLTALSLDGLTTVVGDLAFSDRALARLALPALASVGGALTIEQSLQLSSVELPALHQVGRDLTVDAALFLTTLSLPALRQIGGQLALHSVDSLATIDLDNLEQIGGLRLSFLGARAAFGLPGLRTISGVDATQPSLLVELTKLQTIEFPSLTTISGPALISGNAQLRDVRFPALTDATSLRASDCPALEVMAAPVLTSTGALAFVTTPALATLDVASLAHADSVFLFQCGLSDLSGLRALASAAIVHIESAPHLADVRGLAALRDLRLLDLEDNAALTSLDGLELLATRLVTVTLANNAALTSVAGLRNVASLTSLSITGNAVLPAIALTSLATIAGDLTITNNPLLTSLSGLDTLTSVGGTLHVTGNPALAPAELAAFLARLGH